MFYNFNTLTNYLITCATNLPNIIDPHNPIIFTTTFDSINNLKNYYNNIIVDEARFYDENLGITIRTGNKTIISNNGHREIDGVGGKFKDISFIYAIDNNASDMTIPLHNFLFDSIEISFGSYGNNLSYYKTIDNKEFDKSNIFDTNAKFIINESLIFNLENRISNSDFLFHLNSTDNEMMKISSNIAKSLKLIDSTIYDRPCDVSYDLLEIDFESHVLGEKNQFIIFDGSFTKLQQSYFNQYNETVNVTFEFEDIPILINPYTISPTETELKYQPILRYYIGDEYIPLHILTNNTIFSNFKIGNNIFDDATITTGLKISNQLMDDINFIDGSIIQFSSEYSDIKSSPKPTEPDSGEGEGEIIPPEPPTINTQDEYIITNHVLTMVAEPPYFYNSIYDKDTNLGSLYPPNTLSSNTPIMEIHYDGNKIAIQIYTGTVNTAQAKDVIAGFKFNNHIFNTSVCQQYQFGDGTYNPQDSSAVYSYPTYFPNSDSCPFIRYHFELSDDIFNTTQTTPTDPINVKIIYKNSNYNPLDVKSQLISTKHTMNSSIDGDTGGFNQNMGSITPIQTYKNSSIYSLQSDVSYQHVEFAIRPLSQTETQFENELYDIIVNQNGFPDSKYKLQTVFNDEAFSIQLPNSLKTYNQMLNNSTFISYTYDVEIRWNNKNYDDSIPIINIKDKYIQSYHTMELKMEFYVDPNPPPIPE